MGVNPMRQMGIMPTENQDWLSQIAALLTGWAPMYNRVMSALGYEIQPGMQNTPMTKAIVDEYAKTSAKTNASKTQYSRAGTKEGIQKIVMEKFGFTTPEQYATFAGTDIGKKYIDELRNARLTDKE